MNLQEIWDSKTFRRQAEEARKQRDPDYQPANIPTSTQQKQFSIYVVHADGGYVDSEVVDGNDWKDAFRNYLSNEYSDVTPQEIQQDVDQLHPGPKNTMVARNQHWTVIVAPKDN